MFYYPKNQIPYARAIRKFTKPCSEMLQARDPPQAAGGQHPNCPVQSELYESSPWGGLPELYSVYLRLREKRMLLEPTVPYFYCPI